jgi:hypothetical protein
MPYGWVAGAAVVGSLITSQAAKSAANTQAQAGTNAANAQAAVTTQQLAQQQAQWQQSQTNAQPYMQAGASAMNQLTQGMQPGGALNQQFLPSSLNTDPSYQWRLNQGMQATQASAAARGGLLTGQGGVDLQNYAQNAASQEYGAAFGRQQTQQTNQFNKLSSIAGMGQASAANMASTGTQVSNNMANTAMAGQGQVNNYNTSAANAQAAGQVGVANAWGNNLNQGVSNAMTWNYLQNQPKQP